jgi:hypothetical protein
MSVVKMKVKNISYKELMRATQLCGIHTRVIPTVVTTGSISKSLLRHLDAMPVEKGSSETRILPSKH